MKQVFNPNTLLFIAGCFLCIDVCHCDDWLIGDTTAELLTDFANNKYLFVRNPVGPAPKSFLVDLYDENCINIVDPTSDGTLQILGASNFDGEFTFEIHIDETEIPSSSLTTFTDSSEIAFSTGELRFCLRLETMLDSTPITFQLTNFVLTFDLSTNTYGIPKTSNAMGGNVLHEVTVCLCDELSTECISPAVIEQSQAISVCLESDETTFEIVNFSMRFANGDDSYGYNPVAIGIFSYEALPSTAITPLLNIFGNIIFLVTSTPPDKLYAGDGGTALVVSGSVVLRLKSETKSIVANYEMNAIVNNDKDCLKRRVRGILQRMRRRL